MILNYNGKIHLPECLSSALEASKSLEAPCPVVVADNCSTQDDVSFIRQNFPRVEIVSARSNDMLFSLNEMVARRPEDIVLILNNDMRFDRDFIGPLLENFNDREVFAVSARVLDWEGRETTIAKRFGYFKNFWFYKKWDIHPQTSCLSLDAGGGCSAFRREMFVELGGFDRLYYPAYCEDTDLSYRAWKRGWKVLYEPRSVIYHKKGATLDELRGRLRNARLICRNEVLFTVKNCGGFFFVVVYCLLLPLRIVRNYLSGNHYQAEGLWDALWKLPLAFLRRFTERITMPARIKEKNFLERINRDR